MMVTNLARSFDEHANTFKYAQIIPGNRFSFPIKKNILTHAVLFLFPTQTSHPPLP